MNNRKITLKLIKSVVEKVAAKIHPDKVVLFGSFAYGQPSADSDVDLLFVKRTALSGLSRYMWMSEHIEHLFPMDILIKTPQEVSKRLKMGDPFYKEIIRKGKILYDVSQ